MGKLVISLTYKKEPCSLRNRALFQPVKERQVLVMRELAF